MSLFDDIFGKMGPTHAEANAKAKAALAQGVAKGFALAINHVEKFLLRKGELNLADQVKKFTIETKK